MKTIIIVAALLCLAAAGPKHHQLEGYTFEQYAKDFKKAYSEISSEFLHRMKIFEKNLAEIKSFNAHSGATYKKGVNQFTDMTQEELKEQIYGRTKQMKNSKSSHKAPRNLMEGLADMDVSTFPTHVDWRQQGIVSPVKDQGHCGSCWAFATTAVIESYAAITSGQLKTLSTQQLVSCVQNPYQCGGSGGCDGAIEDLGFAYAQLFGMTSEYKYGYASYQGDTPDCTFNPKTQTVEVSVGGYQRLPENDYKALLYTIAYVGPATVSVDASDFHQYESGVFTGCTDYDNVDTNHAVVMVGYGTDPLLGDYWLVRNSWGTRFGEDGYIRVRRDSNPVCKIDWTPLDGSGCVGFDTPQTVCGQCGILSDSSIPIDVRVL